MKMSFGRTLLAVSLPLLLLADIAPDGGIAIGGREAQAIIGAPLTPLSYAGVARRTTRRAVVATSAVTTAAVTTSVVASNQAAASQAAAAQAAANSAAASAQAASNAAQSAARAAAPGSVPIGTIVAALPAGCVATPKGGVEYYVCGSTYYRAAFQGNNLVYVVQAP